MEKKFKTLEAAVDYLMSLRDSDVSDFSDEDFEICQLPPDENDRISEEEDIDDNNLSPVVPADVSGHLSILTNKLSINQNSLENQNSASFSNEQRNKPKKLCSSSRFKKVKASTPKWKKSVIFSKPIKSEPLEKITDKFPELMEADSVDIFFKFLSKEYIKYLAEMTSTYAAQKGTNIQTDWKDIAQFFGLLLLSGYHQVPTENDYWSTSEDVSVPITTSVMSRKKFKEIKRNFHLMDNTLLQPIDIQPIYDELNKKFIQFGLFHNQLSIDESMVPYYGHHSSKMFLRGKPIRFGFKIWMICSNNGYPYKMEIYTGKQSNEIAPLGTRVVNNLLTIVSNPLQVEIFFDNFFTTYDLMKDLAERNIKAIGTIREHRIKKCPLMLSKEMKKLERGSFDYQCDGSVFLCRWNDNSVVTVSSNFCNHLPMQLTKRYSSKEKKKVDIQQPNLIHKYNTGMGGVDLLDRMLGSYRPMLRNKKWWWNLFVNALNMAVVAGWILHSATHEKNNKLTHLEFRRQVTTALLRIAPRKVGPQPGPKVHRPISQRKSDGHFLVQTTQGRCAQCTLNARLACNECKKKLHLHCFPIYHGIKV